MQETQKEELWEIRFSYEDIGCLPSDGIQCQGVVYIIASSLSEAESKAKKFSEIKNYENATLKTRKYIPPVLSLKEDRDIFGLELKVNKFLTS